MAGKGSEAARQRVALPLVGMHCAECALNIEKSILHLPGVAEANVNYVTNRATVVFEPARISLEEVKRGFEKPGYHVGEQPRFTLRGLWKDRGQWLLTGMVGLGVGVSWVSRWTGMAEPLADVAALAAAGIGGLVILRRALRAIWERSLNVDVLVTMAVAGAIVLRQYQAGGTVVFIVLFGEWLEEFTLAKSRAAVSRLLEVLSEVALVRREGREKEVKAEEVLLTDVAIVKPGGRIPVDGTVVAGSGWVNQAAVTGESALVEKGPGSSIFAGTLLDVGALEIKPTRVGGETTVARIHTLVEQANEQKAPIERLADRYASWFIPTVLVVAGAAYLITGEVLRALTVLIVACPCGLILATPTAVFAGIAHAARRGILVRGGAYLEAAGRVKAVVFDKTGTLTYGVPRVISVVPWNGREEGTVLALAAAAERMSEHPLAAAILARAEEEGVSANGLAEFAVLKGKGLAGGAEDRKVVIGNRRLLEENGVGIPKEALRIAAENEKEGRTVVFLGEDGALAAMFAIGDELRPEAAEAVEELREMGIASIAMITGDSRATAQAVAGQAGIQNVLAEILPEEKMAVVRDIQRRGVAVAMAGDGINDAPALAAADLGIAMGVSGSDVAIETAPVALLQDELLRVPEIISLGRAALAIIGQNMIFSLAYNVLAVGFAVEGSLGPIWGAVIHEAGSVAVILNSMRLLRFRCRRPVQGRCTF